MTNPMSPRDPDAILNAWLEEGPNQLPEITRRAIGVGLRSTRQSRRVLDVPWRPNTMNSFARLAVAAAAIVIVAGGALYLLAPGYQGVGSPTPTPSPSPAVSADLLDVSTWTPFTSSRYGFSARYPATFEAVPSNFFWRIPNAAGNMFDGFHGAGAVKWLNGVSMLLPAGTTRDEWLDEYRRDVVEDDVPWEPESCFAPVEDWSPTTVDGNDADLRVSCEALEVFVFVAGRVYVFGAFGYDGISPPTATPGVSDELRELFELWLTTITLDPVSATDSSPIPTPSST